MQYISGKSIYKNEQTYVASARINADDYIHDVLFSEAVDAVLVYENRDCHLVDRFRYAPSRLRRSRLRRSLAFNIPYFEIIIILNI